MSATNYFIVSKRNSSLDSGLEKCSNELVELAKQRGIGIHFNTLDYESPLLKELGIERDYFTLSDSFDYQHTDELFDIVDCFKAIKHLPPKEGLAREKELLLKKFSFLNEIIEILFRQPNIEFIEFYDGEWGLRQSGYKVHIEVKDRNLTEAFVNRLEPVGTKRQENYFGSKTTKFLIR